MKGFRRLLALLLSLILITSVSATAWATDESNNGVITPQLWTSTQTYDWYTAFTAQTARSTGQAETKTYTFEVKANVAKLDVDDDGVRELDVAVNGQRLNLNTFFDNGRGKAEFDISGLIKYGENTLAVQSLGTPEATANISVEAPAFTARVLHTNDLHAAVDTLPKIAAYVKATKAAGGNTFFVDAGDNFSGNPISDLNAGQPMIEELNLSSVDVFTVGNHDFDPGPANMQMLRGISNFSWLSANTEVVDQSATPIQPFEGYKIFTNDLGQKIGFIALTQTPPATSTKNQVGLRFNDPLAVAQQLIAELRPQVNLLVVVSHNGVDWDKANAPALAGADLIVGAHSHTNLTKPTVVAGIPIVQVGSSGANVGDVILRQAGAVDLTAGGAGGKYEVAVKSMTAVDPDVQAVVDKWTGLMGPVLNRKIGYTPTPLPNDGAKTSSDIALGNLIADGLRDYMGADMGVWNNGGIRGDGLPAGDITMNSVYTVLPFGNIPWKVQLTGAQMVQLLANSFGKYNSIDLQIAGASYIAYTLPDGKLDRIDLKVAGVPVDLNKLYTLAVSDYVATTPTYWKNTTFPTPVEMSSEVDAIAVADYVEKLGTLNYAPSEGRIKMKASPTPVPVTSVNFYSTASLLANQDGALVPLTNQADVLVSAESTAYQIDNPSGDNAPKNFVHVDAGQPLPLAAIQAVGSGKVVGMGAILVSNGYKTSYQQAQWFTNLLDYLGGAKNGTILVDEGHGQYYGHTRLTQIQSFLADRGWTMNYTGANTRLTAEKLAGVKILMITTPNVVGAYNADELSALSIWVAGGGNLILASQADYGGSSNPAEMNTLAAGVGTLIRFNSDQVTDDTNNAGGANYSPVTNEFSSAYPDLLKSR